MSTGVGVPTGSLIGLSLVTTGAADSVRYWYAGCSPAALRMSAGMLAGVRCSGSWVLSEYCRSIGVTPQGQTAIWSAW